MISQRAYLAPEFGTGVVLVNGMWAPILTHVSSIETYARLSFSLICLKPWSRRSFSVEVSKPRPKRVRHMHPERGNWNTWVDGPICDRIKQSATATTRNKMYANELSNQYLCSVYLPRRATLRHFYRTTQSRGSFRFPRLHQLLNLGHLFPFFDRKWTGPVSGHLGYPDNAD